jgi:hypothetical protein
MPRILFITTANDSSVLHRPFSAWYGMPSLQRFAIEKRYPLLFVIVAWFWRTTGQAKMRLLKNKGHQNAKLYQSLFHIVDFRDYFMLFH